MTLATAAPSDGVFISLTSSDPLKVTVEPENIFIPQGATAPGRAPTVNGISIGSAIITAWAIGLAPASGKVQVRSNPITPAPTIAAFSATPSTITAGQAATLSWSVSGANTVSIDNGVGDVSSVTSKLVSPTQTTTYLLTATNSVGSAAARVTVTVTSVPDTQPPTAPTLVSAFAKGPAEVDLVWTASTDNVGVAGYQINRNGSVVISVSSASLSYADTGVSASMTYTYSLKAYDAAGNYSTASNSIQVTTPAVPGSTIITSCGPITQSGHYVLGGNLSAAPNTSCINMHDAHDIYLDCQQHGVTIDRRTDPGNDSAIVVTNVINYSISNCTLTALNTTGTASLATLSVVNSPQGAITTNTFSGGYVAFSSSDLQIARNTSDAPFYVAGNNEKIEDNTIVLKPSQTYPAVLALGNSGNSSGSMVQRNVFNGGWDGVAGQSPPFPVGADDGILLNNVSNTVVQNNTVLNAWDAGIENAGPMVNVQILNNQITTVGTGIGGWYGDSLSNVTLTGNTVTDASNLFLFFRAGGLVAGETSIFFVNTNVTNNKLVQPRMSSSMNNWFDFLDLPSGIPVSAVVSGNNKFANNDFGPGNPPRLLPAGSIVDGGGNICVPDATPGFPLHCIPPTAP
jgi:Right handed beta helix region